MYLRRYSETEKAILHSAIKELDKTFPVRDSVDTTCEFYVSLWDIYAKENEEKVEYGSQGERDCEYST